MSDQTLRPADWAASVRVWPQLEAERRSQVIRLMAQLAFKLVLAQPNSPLKEVDHAVAPERIQNPG